MQTEILLELRKLNNSLTDITVALKAIAAKDETCDTCGFFHKGGCKMEHKRYDGYCAPCVDGCRACLDWEPGENSHQDVE